MDLAEGLSCIVDLALAQGSSDDRVARARALFDGLDLSPGSQTVQSLLAGARDLDIDGFFEAVGAALDEIRREDAQTTYRDLVGEYVSLD